jgi:hypothetical protein
MKTAASQSRSAARQHNPIPAAPTENPEALNSRQDAVGFDGDSTDKGTVTASKNLKTNGEVTLCPYIRTLLIDTNRHFATSVRSVDCRYRVVKFDFFDKRRRKRHGEFMRSM